MEENDSMITFTKEEKKIRKRWFVSYFIVFIFFCFTVLFALTFFIIIFISNPSKSFFYFFITWIIGSIAYISPNYFLYRCAYKKQGTKFLIFNFSLLVITFIINFIHLIEIKDYSLLVLTLIIYWYLYINWKLLQINRKFKNKSLKPLIKTDPA
ncbi:MAG: hypothetical protein K1060chlam5_00613 [Candidatus Anoxychlamydiales bacterium]|nr:hypothetical protein [Candidatus Anoxychlamydiales bacterium]